MSTPQVERHLHWQFLAHDEEELRAKDVHWPVVVVVIGYETEADATIAAEIMIQRRWYLLQKVWECPSCGYQSAMTQSMKELTGKI